jgi:NarL family two-component system response regulator LiaR
MNKMPLPIRLLLVDDHELLRQGTAELLGRQPDLQIVGQAADGRQAIDLARQLMPDIVIMDIRMPEMSGLEATRRLRQELPGIRVLVLTAYDDADYVFPLLEAGAAGYLLKSAPVAHLIQAIRQVDAGETPLDPAIAHLLVERLGETQSKQPPGALYENLTVREHEVLARLAAGLSNRRIGQGLGISERTVQAHLTSIFGKMQVTSRTQAVTEAVKRGWITLDPGQPMEP